MKVACVASFPLLLTCVGPWAASVGLHWILWICGNMLSPDIIARRIVPVRLCALGSASLSVCFRCWWSWDSWIETKLCEFGRNVLFREVICGLYLFICDMLCYSWLIVNSHTSSQLHVLGSYEWLRPYLYLYRSKECITNSFRLIIFLNKKLLICLRHDVMIITWRTGVSNLQFTTNALPVCYNLTT